MNRCLLIQGRATTRPRSLLVERRMRRIYPEAPLTPSQKEKRYYEKHRESELERNRIYHQDNKDAIRIRHRNNRHHIKQEQFDAIFVSQDGKCKICHKVLTDTPHIDHNHRCCPGNGSCDKCRRALLCKHCNVLIGMCFESIEILRNAIQYLEGYQCQSITESKLSQS